ncbi:MAG: H-NS histone family protein [Pseudomonadota bacterium]
MNLSKMSAAELLALEATVSGLIEKRQKKDREDAIERIYAVAHGLGMPLHVVLEGGSPPPTRTRRMGQKYQDPKNSQNKWSGNGPRPGWLKAAMAAGVALEMLRA